MIDAREHFRAPVSDEQFALLVVGLERLTVQLVEQSSGGLSMLTARRPAFTCDSPAEVKYPDGYCITGRIKHIDPCDEGVRIGFQRSEMIQERQVDLRELFPTSRERTLSPVAVAMVLLFGLALGWLWQSGTAQKFYERAVSTMRTR